MNFVLRDSLLAPEAFYAAALALLLAKVKNFTLLISLLASMSANGDSIGQSRIALTCHGVALPSCRSKALCVTRTI